VADSQYAKLVQQLCALAYGELQHDAANSPAVHSVSLLPVARLELEQATNLVHAIAWSMQDYQWKWTALELALDICNMQPLHAALALCCQQ
jgi:hypothetical protein